MIVTPRQLAALATAALITLGAACGSDSDGDSSTVATTAVVGSTPDASTPDTATGDSAAPATVGPVDDSLSDRTAIVNYTLAQAGAAGVTLDSQCVLDLVAQLSDEDAALLAASARSGDAETPALSAEGEALGQQLGGCIAGAPETTTVG